MRVLCLISFFCLGIAKLAYGDPIVAIKTFTYDHDLPITTPYIWRTPDYSTIYRDRNARPPMLPDKEHSYAFRISTVNDIPFRLEELKDGDVTASHDLFYPTEGRLSRDDWLMRWGREINHLPQRVAIHTAWRTNTPTGLYFRYYLQLMIGYDRYSSEKSPALQIAGTTPQPVDSLIPVFSTSHLPDIYFDPTHPNKGRYFMPPFAAHPLNKRAQIDQRIGSPQAIRGIGNFEGYKEQFEYSLSLLGPTYFGFKSRGSTFEVTDTFLLTHQNETETAAAYRKSISSGKAPEFYQLPVATTASDKISWKDLPTEFQMILFPAEYRESQRAPLRQSIPAFVAMTLTATVVISAFLTANYGPDPTRPVATSSADADTDPLPPPKPPVEPEPLVPPNRLEEQEGTIAQTLLLRIQSACNELAETLGPLEGAPYKAMSVYVDKVIGKIDHQHDFSLITLQVMQETRSKLQVISSLIEQDLRRDATSTAAARLIAALQELDRAAEQSIPCEDSLAAPKVGEGL